MEASASRSPMSEYDRLLDDRQEDVCDARPKKRTRAAKPSNFERKKVSRACDACKEKKVRCAGTQPCPRCSSNSLRCHYNAEHRRGKPAPPQPATYVNNPKQNIPLAVSTQGTQSRDLPTGNIGISHADVANPPEPEPRDSAQSWQGDDENPLENDYIGPTSGIAFLARSQRRFHEDFIESRSGNEEQSSQTSIFSYGDGWIPDPEKEFTFPSREEAQYLLQQYFDFAMPTYRFLHRETVETWLESIHSSIEDNNPGILTVSKAKKALVILMLATAKLYGDADLERDSESSNAYYTAAEKLLSCETGSITLEAVQARLSQCIYLLASSRINNAWYAFGTTAQLIIALGLHRREVYQAPNTSHSNIVFECRKRVFWSAYTLDRYMSVILGRPRIFRDEDIDRPLPDRSEIVLQSTRTMTEKKSGIVHSVDDGPIFHARLAKIIGGISSDLYSTHRTESGSWLQSAERWTVELKVWKESLPAFLNPSKVDPSTLISIFQRQSTVLSLAYAHALILANRPSLLSNFADLARRTGPPSDGPSNSLKDCITAAMTVVDTVTDLIEDKRMRHSFWFTHYISFCAISALYVYTIQQCLLPQQPTSSHHDPQMFEAAERCQNSIKETTTKTSPFRKYNIILDELKKEVVQHLGPRYVQSGELNTGVHIRIRNGHSSHSVAQSTHLPRSDPILSSDNLAMSSTQYSSAAGNPAHDTSQHLTLHSLQSEYFDTNSLVMVEDQSYNIPSGNTYFPGFQGEVIGWSEFDSCALNWPEIYGGLEQGYEM